MLAVTPRCSEYLGYCGVCAIEPSVCKSGLVMLGESRFPSVTSNFKLIDITGSRSTCAGSLNTPLWIEQIELAKVDHASTSPTLSYRFYIFTKLHPRLAIFMKQGRHRLETIILRYVSACNVTQVRRTWVPVNSPLSPLAFLSIAAPRTCLHLLTRTVERINIKQIPCDILICTVHAHDSSDLSVCRECIPLPFLVN